MVFFPHIFLQCDLVLSLKLQYNCITLCYISLLRNQCIFELWNTQPFWAFLLINKKRNQTALPSFTLKQNLTWILLLQFVLPWSLSKSEAGNNLAKSLCLTLLGGGIKAYLGVPFCYCINVVGGSEGCDPRRALISPLQALLQTPQGIFWDTYRHIRTPITVGHTRMGRAV